MQNGSISIEPTFWICKTFPPFNAFLIPAQAIGKLWVDFDSKFSLDLLIIVSISSSSKGSPRLLTMSQIVERLMNPVSSSSNFWKAKKRGSDFFVWLYFLGAYVASQYLVLLGRRFISLDSFCVCFLNLNFQL